jgi:hypothetical protein
MQVRVFRIGLLLRILIVAERHGLIAKKGPPRLCRPATWCWKIARYGGLGDREPELQKFAMDPWSTPEKILTGHLVRSAGGPHWRPSDGHLASDPRDRYLQIANQPLRRQRKTVSGSKTTRLSRQPDHQRDSKIHSSRSIRRKHGRRVRLRYSTAI